MMIFVGVGVGVGVGVPCACACVCVCVCVPPTVPVAGKAELSVAGHQHPTWAI